MYKYYYSKLSADNKRLYDKMYQGYCAYEDEVFLGAGKIDINTLSMVNNCIMLDYPLMFFVGKQVQTQYNSLEGTRAILHYYFPKNVTNRYLEQINKAIKDMMDKIVARSKSEYDIVLSTYSTLISSVEYDYDSYKKLGSGSSEDSVYAHTLLGVFYRKSAVCEGIAEAFKACMDHVGIRCICVEGQSVHKEDGALRGHEWNICQINGTYYHMDATWDLCDKKKGDKLTYDYFGLSDAEIKKDHFQFSGVPICNSREANYYERQRVVAHSKSEMERMVRSRFTKVPCEFMMVLGYPCVMEKESGEIMEVMKKIATEMNVGASFHMSYSKEHKRFSISVSKI